MQLPQQENYEIALGLAQEALRQTDPEERCARSGALFRPEEKRVEIPFLHRRALLPWPEMTLTWADGEPVEIREQILLLHYLQTATGAPLTGEWISFAQVPGGEFYVEPFRHRSILRLVRTFGDRAQELIPAAEALGGQTADLGGVSVSLPVFPRVPITFVLWPGDEEIPSSGNVLFDSSIPQYLPVEDIVVVCGAIAGWLCRYLH